MVDCQELTPQSKRRQRLGHCCSNCCSRPNGCRLGLVWSGGPWSSASPSLRAGGGSLEGFFLPFHVPPPHGIRWDRSAATQGHVSFTERPTQAHTSTNRAGRAVEEPSSRARTPSPAPELKASARRPGRRRRLGRLIWRVCWHGLCVVADTLGCLPGPWSLALGRPAGRGQCGR